MLFIFEGGNARKHLQSLPEINRKCLKKQQLSIYFCAVWNFISVGGLKKDLLLSSATHHDSAMLNLVISFFLCFLLLEKNAGFVYRDKGAWLSAIFAGLGKHG